MNEIFIASWDNMIALCLWYFSIYLEWEGYRQMLNPVVGVFVRDNEVEFCLLGLRLRIYYESYPMARRFCFYITYKEAV